MTDATEPLVIEYLRQEARDGSEFLYDVYGGVVCATSMVLDGFATLTRERDEARKERDHYMIVGLQRLDRIYAVETQLASARELMAEAATDIGYMVNAEYHGPDDVHPAMRAKYTRDMEIVSRLTAALTQEGA
jgi:uncharacterized protein with PhoU and TrkA domain